MWRPGLLTALLIAAPFSVGCGAVLTPGEPARSPTPTTSSTLLAPSRDPRCAHCYDHLYPRANAKLRGHHCSRSSSDHSIFSDPDAYPYSQCRDQAYSDSYVSAVAHSLSRLPLPP